MRVVRVRRVCRAVAVSDCFGGSGHVAAIRELASEGADVDTGIQPGHSGGCGYNSSFFSPPLILINVRRVRSFVFLAVAARVGST